MQYSSEQSRGLALALGWLRGLLSHTPACLGSSSVSCPAASAWTSQQTTSGHCESEHGVWLLTSENNPNWPEMFNATTRYSAGPRGLPDGVLLPYGPEALERGMKLGEQRGGFTVSIELSFVFDVRYKQTYFT